MNVFKYACRSRYYIKHPLKFLRETGQNLLAAWHRSTRGYANIDVWNMSEWMLEVLPQMLRQLAGDLAYPGEGTDFDTPEKWEAWLHQMANTLEDLQDENWEKHNEYEEEFFELSERNRQTCKDEDGLHVTWASDANYEDIRKKYFARARELYDERQQILQDAFAQIGKYFDMLWS